MTFDHILIWGDTPLAAHLAIQLSLQHKITWLTSLDKDDLKIAPTVTLVTEMQAAKKPDLIILASPAWFTAQAIRTLQTFVPPQQSPPPMLLLQWGYGGLQQAYSAFGQDSILYGMVTKPIGWESNHPQAENWGGIALQYDHPHTEAIATLLHTAGWQVELGPAEAIQWSSVFWGIQANAISSILNIDPMQVYQDPMLFGYEYRQLTEALRILAQAEVPMIPLPDVDIPALVQTMIHTPMADLPSQLMSYPRPPSLKTDLLAQTGRNDAAYLHGAIALRADGMKLQAPLNHALAFTLTDIAEGRALWEPYQRAPQLLMATLRLANG